MPIYLGHGAAIGFGIESTWGTEAARTNWMRCVSISNSRAIEKPPRPHLGTNGATYYTRRSHYVQSDMSSGSFEVLASYNDSTVLLMAYLFGAAVDAGGASPYTHTITCAEPGHVGLSMETILGTGHGEQWEGTKVNRGEFSIEAGGIARLRVDWIAEKSSGLESAGSPSYATEDHILHSHAGQFGLNGSNYDLVSLNIVRDRKLATRQLLGSVYTKEPLVSDFPEVTGSFVIEYQGTALDGLYIADTQADGTITFTGSAISGGNNSLAITLHNIVLTSVSREVSGPGVIRETFAFRCEATGSESGASFVVSNANSLYTANG